MLRKFAWSKEEEEALKELYPKYLQGLIDREDFKSVFPKRTFESLKRKADEAYHELFDEGGVLDQIEARIAENNILLAN